MHWCEENTSTNHQPTKSIFNNSNNINKIYSITARPILNQFPITIRNCIALHPDTAPHLTAPHRTSPHFTSHHITKYTTIHTRRPSFIFIALSVIHCTARPENYNAQHTTRKKKTQRHTTHKHTTQQHTTIHISRQTAYNTQLKKKNLQNTQLTKKKPKA